MNSIYIMLFMQLQKCTCLVHSPVVYVITTYIIQAAYAVATSVLRVEAPSVCHIQLLQIIRHYHSCMTGMVLYVVAI